MKGACLVPMLLAVVACAEPRFEGTAADPRVKVPSVPFQSILATYRAAPEEDVRPSWGELNDEVGRIRGHEGQLEDLPAPKAESEDEGLTKDPPIDRSIESQKLPQSAPEKKN